MSRIVFALGVMMIFVCCVHRSESSTTVTRPSPEIGAKGQLMGQPDSLDGAYELVSDTLDLIEPEHRSERRTSDEWVGLWLFHNRRFSQTLMKRRRSSWLSGFPSEPDKLGFDHRAGSYTVVGTTVELKVEMSFYPGEQGRPIVLEYLLDGDDLTLTEKIYPNKESLSGGKRVTMLRRVK